MADNAKTPSHVVGLPRCVARHVESAAVEGEAVSRKWRRCQVRLAQPLRICDHSSLPLVCCSVPRALTFAPDVAPSTPTAGPAVIAPDKEPMQVRRHVQNSKCVRAPWAFSSL